MELDKTYVEKLLKLYEEGETTLEQERALKSYFSNENYDSDFEAYALLFQFFEKESTSQSPPLKTKEKKTTHQFWINIAASICIVLGGVWFYNFYENQQELEEARLAFETTQNALNYLSINMNEGLEKLEYVEVFSQQKNKLIK
ncbi:hypothetical protein [Psychroflexus sediminis]|uniref:Uncharacterized protein n=1 Tax=Psychroflexus sediminis TaxID=470826 RepID=A0A1G7VB28_9FLAO|nr:hypothetical protein [Psychroflexus sediminis]SDG57006.1 hypothetical protein SAMN04488027_103205 [Psychroflexus sediminis]